MEKKQEKKQWQFPFPIKVLWIERVGEKKHNSNMSWSSS